ncbi:MAG: undecaprenyl-diphosphate phosphatase [Verrucomicrobia bacterium]|nr:undecaprenyl-diphosphate phosphatase [Verrucomicrobiota bacterium]MCH8526549.1 undecaprenyl-diphosphate phosphatase [Kiritimatiellia bacterium]
MRFYLSFLLVSLFSLLPLAADTTLSSRDAIVLGIVEGLTEYVPVSSTGHLILTSQALGLGEEPEVRSAINTYLVVIQVGAIMAVVTVYGKYLWMMFLGLFGKSHAGRHLLGAVIIAFIPAAVVGLLLERWIDKYLFGLWPVVFAWLVGGIALIIWGRKPDPRVEMEGLLMKDIDTRKALIIGGLQVIAMWPGTSRSLVTILGGRLAGLSMKESVTFSFLLGMLTLTAATFYKLLGQGQDMIEVLGVQNLVLGTFVAWIAAWVAVKSMVAYLKKHGLGLFGFYRVALAVVTTILLLQGIVTP